MVQERVLLDAGVPQEQVQHLKTAWDEFTRVKDRPQREKPSIVCAGIYNAGKSTLLNAMTEQTNEYFPTGNVPTTRKMKRLEYQGAIYIDTPGLNADAEDDAETREAYESADYILFVTNTQDGGITAKEAEWLCRMRDRYTQEGFRQRLIYVMSQSDQVADEDLPGIRDRALQDFEKALGFTPDPVFAVDSVSWQEGQRDNNLSALEESGIPALRSYLLTKTAEAQETLARAEQAELDARRQEVSALLFDIVKVCRTAQESSVQETSAKLEEVDKAWTAFTDKLYSSMPVENVSPISGPNFYFTCDYSDCEVEGNSRYGVISRAKEIVRHYYDKQQSAVDEWAEEAVSAYQSPRPYFQNGIGSAYFRACDAMNSAFSEGVLALQRIGVPVTAPVEITVEAELPYDLESEAKYTIKNNVITSDYNYTYYIDRLREPRSSVSYERGLFGRERQVWTYRVSVDSVVSRMDDVLSRRIELCTGKANDLINKYWKRFRDKLLNEVETRKGTVKQQVDDFRRQLEQDSKDTEKAEAALAHLDALVKEARA